MKRVRLSIAMDRKKSESPIAVLFTVPEGEDPFQKLLVKKYKRHMFYRKELEA